MMSKLLNIYSLCNDECENGKHNEMYEICDRCGSHIHAKIFEINHETEGYVKVGSECFKDMMGFNYNKSHEKADKLYKEIKAEIIKVKIKYNYDIEKKYKWNIKNFTSNLLIIDISTGINTIKGKLNKSIIKAGIDLNLWESINYKSIIIKL